MKEDLKRRVSETDLEEARAKFIVGVANLLIEQAKLSSFMTPLPEEPSESELCVDDLTSDGETE